MCAEEVPNASKSFSVMVLYSLYGIPLVTAYFDIQNDILYNNKLHVMVFSETSRTEYCL